MIKIPLYHVCTHVHMYIHNHALMVRNSYNQPSKCQTKITLGQPFVLAKVKCYRISGNIGDIFNLAVWRSGSKSPNFYHQIHINLLTMLYPCCATVKFIIFANFYYSLILRKSPNLMIANISGYTVFLPLLWILWLVSHLILIN